MPIIPPPDGATGPNVLGLPVSEYFLDLIRRVEDYASSNLPDLFSLFGPEALGFVHPAFPGRIYMLVVMPTGDIQPLHGDDAESLALADWLNMNLFDRIGMSQIS